MFFFHTFQRITARDENNFIRIRDDKLSFSVICTASSRMFRKQEEKQCYYVKCMNIFGSHCMLLVAYDNERWFILRNHFELFFVS